MVALGMLILGSFVGFCCLYVLFKISDWQSPVAILTGLLSAAVGGGLFVLFDKAPVSIGNAIYYYPVGLGYGALCAGIMWIGNDTSNERANIKYVHIAAFGVVSVLLLLILIAPWFRALLPTTG